MIGHDPSFTELERAVEASIAGQALRRGSARVATAARGSRVLQVLTALVRAAAAQPLNEQLRFLGLVLVTFSITDLGLSVVLPESSAPAFPAFVWGTSLFAGIALLYLGGRATNQKKNA